MVSDLPNYQGKSPVTYPESPSWLPPPAENEICAGAEKSARAQKSAGA